MIPGARNLITDITGLRVGNAGDAVLKSGTTVLTADSPFTAAVHVMGGAPGTRETDLLAPDRSVAGVDALVLSGGSAFGLDACSGVADALRKAGRGYRVGDVCVPIVPGAILFDLLNGGDRNWPENPWRALGERAFHAAAPDFTLGSSGAGTGALSGTLKGGLGSASVVLDSGISVGALVAVNPVGCVTTPGRRHFWAAPFEIGAEFGGLGPDPSSGIGHRIDSIKWEAMQQRDMRANTTIAIVATDATLDKAGCQRLAIAAHAGIARAVVPSHTPYDGDLVFALSTDLHPASRDDLLEIGHAAALCLARAIARGVWLARPAPGDILPCWSEVNREGTAATP